MNTKSITASVILLLAPGAGFAAGAPDVVSMLQQQLDALSRAVVVCPPGAPTRFVDNGDGTICDHLTGLMWEKKTSDAGGADYTDPHNVVNSYKWPELYTKFLSQLNGETAVTEDSEQLGGYRDWRIPTLAELRTLLYEQQFPCSVDPCLADPVFNPVGRPQFTATTYANDPSYAWYIYFGGFGDGLGGTVDKALKGSEDFSLGVRAVRGSMGGRQ
jgi:hypothetical protein